MDQDTELLDIKQAAELLRVSETSLRRWTNAGRLPCFRVGGKRERRFRRADLLAFLEGQAAAPSQAVGHLCGLYTSDSGRENQAVGFLADGLRPDTVCVLVAASDVRARALALLARGRPSLPRDIEAGRLVVAEYAASVAAQLEWWLTRFTAAVRAGARFLRVVGDVSGGPLARGHPFADVLGYEADYDRLVGRRFPVATLCQYDARKLSGVETTQLLRCHEDAFRYPVNRLVN